MKVTLSKKKKHEPSPLRPQVERSSAADNSLRHLSRLESMVWILVWRALCYLCYRTISTNMYCSLYFEKTNYYLLVLRWSRGTTVKVKTGKTSNTLMLISLPRNILKEATRTTSAWGSVGWKNEAIRRMTLNVLENWLKWTICNTATGAAMSCMAVVAAAIDLPLPMRSAIVLLLCPDAPDRSLLNDNYIYNNYNKPTHEPSLLIWLPIELLHTFTAHRMYCAGKGGQKGQTWRALVLPRSFISLLCLE